MTTPSILGIHQNSETTFTREEVQKEIGEYDALFEGADSVEKRKENYMSMVNNFYDLVTDFYEYGWGESFHFARRFKGESFTESIARSEHFLALRLGLKPGMKVLVFFFFFFNLSFSSFFFIQIPNFFFLFFYIKDVGCGIGGPMRSIARFSGASVTGLNNNGYQIKRGTLQTNTAGLSNLCDFLKVCFFFFPFLFSF